MRVILQRVSRASVSIDKEIKSRIGPGILILLGIEDADNVEDIDWLSAKISRLRIFNDENGVMNLSALDVAADIMVVSQFTLHASTRKGNRPSYIRAAGPDVAVPLYELFVEKMAVAIGKPVATGTFGADMKVELVNDGPVTLMIDSKQRDL